MPRDFVPCVYYERELEHPLSGARVICCDVIEMHQYCGYYVREEFARIGPDSHQFTMRDEDCAWEEVPARLRAPLFADFYAAMAALE